MPVNYKTRDGLNLYQWLKDQRLRRGRLSDEQQKMLEDIGFNWISRSAAVWEANYRRLVKYKKQYGDVNVPISYVTEGVRLGRWLSRQKAERDKLSEGQQKK